MARKFITERELDFIDRVNKELIQKVVGQEISYYAIRADLSLIDDLYQESVEKVWDAPVKVNARILWNNDSVATTNKGSDSKYSPEVYFHKLELEERNVVPRDGDFVEIGEVFFEITSVTTPQIVFGQLNNRLMVLCRCTPAREGQFAAGSDSSRGVRNTHPIENTKHREDP